MTLDLYNTEQIGQSILSTAMAMLSSTVANGMANIEHAKGVIDFAKAEAKRYGLDWSGMFAELQQSARLDGYVDLLEATTRAELDA